MIFTALSFYGLFTAYFLDEEVLPVRLYVLINVVLIFFKFALINVNMLLSGNYLLVANFLEIC